MSYQLRAWQGRVPKYRHFEEMPDFWLIVLGVYSAMQIWYWGWTLAVATPPVIQSVNSAGLGFPAFPVLALMSLVGIHLGIHGFLGSSSAAVLKARHFR